MQIDTTPAAVRAVDGTRRGRWLGVTLAILLAVGTFMTGLRLGELGVFADNPNGGHTASILSLFASDASVTAGSGVDLSEFWRVWEIMDRKFSTTATTTLTNQDKLRGAISGLVDAYGDPYTVYLPPADTQALTQDIAGNFRGVGMEVCLRH